MSLRIKIPKDRFDKVLDLYTLLESKASNIELGLFLYLNFMDKSFVKECYLTNFYLLNYAVQMNNFYVVRAMIQTCDMLEYLETEDENKKTPLQISIDNKNVQITEFLLKKISSDPFVHTIEHIIFNGLSNHNY